MIHRLYTEFLFSLSFFFFERDFVDVGRVIKVRQPPTFHSLNPINTKHQTPPASSKKNQTNPSNRQKQSHTTAPSSPKTPNKHDYTESNDEKKYLYWKQESDN